MKKLLSPILGILVISALAVSCDNSNPAAPEDAVTPQFAVVDQYNSNGKSLYAYGYRFDNTNFPADYYSRYSVSVYDQKDTNGKSKRLFVYIRRAFPLQSCVDVVQLGKKEFNWSMGEGGSAWVKAMTACGMVDVTWQRTSDVFEGHYDNWYGATDNCSPPEGQFSWHVVSNGQFAYANASGMAGFATVPATGNLFQFNYARINHGTYHRTVCGSD